MTIGDIIREFRSKVSFDIYRAIDAIIKAPSLTATRRFFHEHTFCNLSANVIENQKAAFSNFINLVMLSHEEELKDILAFCHRLYFTYPLKIPKIFPAAKKTEPTAGNSLFMDILIDIRPVFTEIRDTYFEPFFDQFDKALRTKVEGFQQSTADNSPMLKYFNFVTSLLKTNLVPDRGTDLQSEATVEYVFKSCVINPCVYFLNVLSGSLMSQLRHTRTGFCRPYTPDLSIEYEGRVIFLCELKHPSLSLFIHPRTKKLVTNNKNLNWILKQVCGYFIRTGLDWGIISDFHTSIFLKLDFDENSTLSNIDGEVWLPLKYKIIGNEDNGLTLQGVVASMTYHELLVQEEEKRRDDWTEADVEGTTTKFYKAKVLHMYNSLSKSPEQRRNDQEAKARKQSNRAGDHIESYDKYKTIDIGRFDETVVLNLQSHDELTSIRVGYEYVSQIYLLEYNKYCERFKNLPKIPKKAVLKLYDFDDLVSYMQLHLEDLKMYSLNDTFNIDNMYDYATKLFLNEIACYNKIYSSGESIRVPNLYDYGVMTRVVNGTPISSGFFLLMSYIESNEEDKRLLEMARNFNDISIKDLENHVKPNVMEDLLDQIKLLEKIGVEHGDLYLRNLIPNNGKFTIIDFSHGDVKVKRNTKNDHNSNGF